MARLSSKIEIWKSIPGDPDGAGLKILHLKPGEIHKIESETSHWVGKSVDESFASELHYKPIIQLRKLRMAALTGWRGFYGVDGESLECTTKFKELYLDEDPVLGEGDDAKKLSEWIDQFRKEIADSLKPQEEQAEGNS